MGGFVISGALKINTPLRTIVYIDGFNLYFGCLKRAPQHRWLDIAALSQLICIENNPSAEIIGLKYFTARVKAKLSRRGMEAVKAQDTYINALKAHSSSMDIVEGKYFIVPGSFYADESPVDFEKPTLRVLRGEEKHTDVNIALHMLSDATDGLCDQQVLFSNDSDCAPILKMISERHPEMILGVVPPIVSNMATRALSKDLDEHSSWTRSPISESILHQCQLPDPVRGRKRRYNRPSHWCDVADDSSPES